MRHQSLSSLHITGVRYRGSTFAGADQRALKRYAALDTYTAAGVPFHYTEPTVPLDGTYPSAAHAMGDLCSAIAGSVVDGRRAGHAIAMVGGNCGHAPGVLAGLQQAHGAGARIGLVWLDAHGDFNTPRTTVTGSLGGMPVAVCAGLGCPTWRESAGVLAPLPTDRIVMTDLRNLDPAEAQLLAATDVAVIGTDQPFAGPAFADAVVSLADRVDIVYLHIDADILDATYLPNHITLEPCGPTMAQVQSAVEIVMATGKVVAFALVSVYFRNESVTDLAAGVALLRASLALWRRHGTTGP